MAIAEDIVNRANGDRSNFIVSWLARALESPATNPWTRIAPLFQRDMWLTIDATQDQTTSAVPAEQLLALQKAIASIEASDSDAQRLMRSVRNIERDRDYGQSDLNRELRAVQCCVSHAALLQSPDILTDDELRLHVQRADAFGHGMSEVRAIVNEFAAVVAASRIPTSPGMALDAATWQLVGATELRRPDSWHLLRVGELYQQAVAHEMTTESPRVEELRSVGDSYSRELAHLSGLGARQGLAKAAVRHCLNLAVVDPGKSAWLRENFKEMGASSNSGLIDAAVMGRAAAAQAIDSQDPPAELSELVAVLVRHGADRELLQLQEFWSACSTAARHRDSGLRSEETTSAVERSKIRLDATLAKVLPQADVQRLLEPLFEANITPEARSEHHMNVFMSSASVGDFATCARLVATAVQADPVEPWIYHHYVKGSATKLVEQLWPDAYAADDMDTLIRLADSLAPVSARAIDPLIYAGIYRERPELLDHALALTEGSHEHAFRRLAIVQFTRGTEATARALSTMPDDVRAGIDHVWRYDGPTPLNAFGRDSLWKHLPKDVVDGVARGYSLELDNLGPTPDATENSEREGLAGGNEEGSVAGNPSSRGRESSETPATERDANTASTREVDPAPTTVKRSRRQPVGRLAAPTDQQPGATARQTIPPSLLSPALPDVGTPDDTTNSLSDTGSDMDMPSVAPRAESSPENGLELS